MGPAVATNTLPLATSKPVGTESVLSKGHQLTDLSPRVDANQAPEVSVGHDESVAPHVERILDTLCGKPVGVRGRVLCRPCAQVGEDRERAIALEAIDAHDRIWNTHVGPCQVTSTYARRPTKATSIAPPTPIDLEWQAAPDHGLGTVPRIDSDERAGVAVRDVEGAVGSDGASRSKAPEGGVVQHGDNRPRVPWLVGQRIGVRHHQHDGERCDKHC